MAYKSNVARQGRHNLNAMCGRYPLELDKKTLIDLYTTMLTIRRFEERAYSEWSAGNLFGFVHSYIGQEAIATGVCAHLTKKDRIVSKHRGHGHCIETIAALPGNFGLIGHCRQLMQAQFPNFGDSHHNLEIPSTHKLA